MPLELVPLSSLEIDDERSLRHIGLYHKLKAALAASGYRFYKPAEETPLSWDRALFLNLTFWGSAEAADVLCDNHIAADVVAHVAWHHLAGRHLVEQEPDAERQRSADVLLFAEAIASAFDLYLVGRMLLNAPDSDFITSQVPLMGEAAEEAGMSADDFATLLDDVAREPERAFENLRSLLFDSCMELLNCSDIRQAQEALERRASHRFAPLLHHFQLSAWILYARAYGAPGRNARVTHADSEMRRAPDSLAWLEENWLGD